jgi:sec-independent protein translocase protein TatA
MPFRLGIVEVILILVIILIIFGAGRLPQVGEAIGKGIRSFRRGKSGEDEKEKKVTRKSKKKVVRKIED